MADKCRNSNTEMLLIILKKLKFVSFWELAGICNIQFNELVDIIKELKQKDLINIENNKICITNKGEEAVKDYDWKDMKCKSCKSRGVKIFEEIKDEYEKMVANRPEPVGDYDQGYQTLDSNLARLSYMYMYGDVKNREIIVLGDDDLMSLALSLAGAKKVDVIDIDKRIINYINDKASEFGLNINAFTLDLREPLPLEYINKFDVFVTDPLETPVGFKIMVGRGISSIKPCSSGYFGLTKIESNAERWYELEKIIIDMGAIIDFAIPKFSFYENWEFLEDMGSWEILPNELKVLPEKPWYNSTFFRIVKVKDVKWNEPVEISPENLISDEAMWSSKL